MSLSTSNTSLLSLSLSVNDAHTHTYTVCSVNHPDKTKQKHVVDVEQPPPRPIFNFKLPENTFHVLWGHDLPDNKQGPANFPPR